MISNYYTLLHVARDLDQRLRGRRVIQIFSQSRNELVLQCGDRAFVVVSCEPSRNYVLLRSSFSRARKNSLDFFLPLIDRSIESVALSTGDREIIVRAGGRACLVIQMFGSKANVILVDQEYTITESFLKPKEYVGKMCQSQQSGHPGFGSEQELRRRLESLRDVPLKVAVKKLFPQYGSELIQELLSRAGIDATAQAIDEHVPALFKAHVELLSDLTARPTPRIYYEDSTPRMFSIVPLAALSHLKFEMFDSIHEAIHTFVARQSRDKQLTGKKEEISDVLRREVQKAKKTLLRVREDVETSRRSEEYEMIGKLITANLHTLKKGMNKVQLDTSFTGSPNSVTISLDPRLTPAQNASHYFNMAKKARSSHEENKGRAERLERKLAMAQELLEELDGIQSSQSFREFAELHKDQLVKFGVKLDQRGRTLEEDRVPFRVFTVAGGFQVLVGKSSESNDLLTTKYAKSNDLWFHARGSSGSHVVLKVSSGKREPSKQALDEAAAIAAYYSKMKHSRTVPVAMTLRKYVRKPRGASPGTVTIEREKVLFVEPKLPGQE